jgi:TonB family protein
MEVMSYQKLALDWQPKSRRDLPFLLFSFLILVLFIGAGIYMNSIQVPEKPRKAKVEIPERIAKFIMEKPKPKPKPKPKEVEKPKPKPKPKVKRDRPKKEVKLTKKQKKARKKAEESGLLALSSELSDLVDTSSVDTMVGKKVSSSQSTQAASVTSEKLSEGATTGSEGVKAGEHLAQTQSGTTLDAGQRKVARQLLTSRAASDTGAGKKSRQSGSDGKARIGNYRSEEDIAYVMDRNKSKLHSLYRRARRSNPGIKGKIILEITILPSGKVESVNIKSSELNDSRLESRIIARILQFNFGTKSVKKVTVTYPVEFLPS